MTEFHFFEWPILLRQKGKEVDKAPLWTIMKKFIMTFINHYKQFQIGQSTLLRYSTWCVFWEKCQFYLPLCSPAACVWLAIIYFVCLHLKKKSHKKEKKKKKNIFICSVFHPDRLWEPQFSQWKLYEILYKHITSACPFCNS